MARRRRDGEDGGSAVMWRGRDESLGTKDDVSPHIYNASHAANRQAIKVLWKHYLLFTHLPHTCHNTRMQRFKVAKGSRAPTRVEAENHRTIHAHVVHARSLAPPRLAGRARRAIPNFFNKMEIAQLFKLVSLHLK